MCQGDWAQSADRARGPRFCSWNLYNPTKTHVKRVPDDLRIAKKNLKRMPCFKISNIWCSFTTISHFRAKNTRLNTSVSNAMPIRTIYYRHWSWQYQVLGNRLHSYVKWNWSASTQNGLPTTANSHIHQLGWWWFQGVERINVECCRNACERIECKVVN